jgi:gamma-polyglutamate biosynthesis protein CapA
VFYSLGNFVFDQGWSRTRESVVARYLLQDDGTARIELVPVFIREATPRELPGPSGTYRRERIFQQVSGDGFEWRREDGRLVTEIDHSHVLEGARP